MTRFLYIVWLFQKASNTKSLAKTFSWKDLWISIIYKSLEHLRSYIHRVFIIMLQLFVVLQQQLASVELEMFVWQVGNWD